MEFNSSHKIALSQRRYRIFEVTKEQVETLMSNRRNALNDKFSFGREDSVIWLIAQDIKAERSFVATINFSYDPSAEKIDIPKDARFVYWIHPDAAAQFLAENAFLWATSTT